jgi:hypothetical protein
VVVPEQKVFKPKFLGLPVLADYKFVMCEEFWRNFPVNYTQPAESNIDAGRLLACIEAAGMEVTPQVQKVIKWVAEGAEIGCKGVYTEQHHIQRMQKMLILTAGRCRTP